MPIKFDLSKHRHNKIFIETGTFAGYGVKKALEAGFEKIYSIEIDLKKYKNCVKIFKNYSNVFLYHGDSSIVLKEILDNIDEPCTFWLDAHYCADGATRGKLFTPIKEELDIIQNHSRNNVILIDDIRVFGRDNDYPQIIQLLKKIKEINEDYEIEYLNGHLEGDVLKAYIK